MRPHPSHMLVAAGLSPFTVQASPPSVSVSGSYDGNPKTTGSTTVSILAGPPGATITSVSWARTSGSTGITVNSPSSATTTFSGNPGENSTITAVFRATVVNSRGQTATVDVNASVTAGFAAISPNVSPSATQVVSRPSGTNPTFNFTCAPTCPTSTGPFTETWTAGGASMSPSTGTSSTMTIPSSPAGTQTLASLLCHVTDPAGRVGDQNVNVVVNWT